MTSKHQRGPLARMKAAFLAALLIALVTPALADSGQVGNLGNPGIAPPQSRFRGHTYGEWSAAWFQWVYSMPYTHHPLFDTADCSTGQTGDVWFIGGTFGGSRAVNRTCTVPAGTAFLLAFAAVSYDNASCDSTGTVVQPTTFTVHDLRNFARSGLDSFLDDRAQCEIDGVICEGLTGLDPAYRVQSPVFDYTAPAGDNLLTLIDGPCYYNPPDPTDLTVRGAVADGVYALIRPLPIGQHTIRFGKPGGVPLGVVYHITVTAAW